jgi:hypothetical protein
MLILETWLINRDIGYVKFRAEFFADAAVMNKWPDPEVRERELRDFWNEDANSHYPQYREDTAKMSDNQLIGYRDQLQGILVNWRQGARLPSPGELAGEHHRDDTGGSDAGMSRKGLKALFAEWEEDYAARRAGDSQQRLRSPGEPDTGRGR